MKCKDCIGKKERKVYTPIVGWPLPCSLLEGWMTWVCPNK